MSEVPLYSINTYVSRRTMYTYSGQQPIRSDRRAYVGAYNMRRVKYEPLATWDIMTAVERIWHI